jgi:hypothetical protein
VIFIRQRYFAEGYGPSCQHIILFNLLATFFTAVVKTPAEVTAALGATPVCKHNIEGQKQAGDGKDSQDSHNKVARVKGLRNIEDGGHEGCKEEDSAGGF